MASNYKCSNKGFSLIEVIVAVVILSMGIVTVMQALSALAHSTGLSSDMVNAAFLAKDKLEELEFKEARALIGNEPNVVTVESGKFKIQTSLNFAQELDLYSLNLAIKWKRINREECLDFNTYLRQ